MLLSVCTKAEATLARIAQSALALLHHSPMHLSRLIQRLCHAKLVGAKANSDGNYKKISRHIFKNVYRYCMTHVVSAALKAPMSARTDLELLELVVAMQQISAAIKLAGKLMELWVGCF